MDGSHQEARYGIYDEQGNLIGDKFDEDDAYDWD